MLPLNLYLVRHGESEGNVALKAVERGHPEKVPGNFWLRPSHLWRLTRRGVIQAQASGAWLHDNLVGPVGRALVSPYTRAMETAGHLLPEVPLMVVSYLRERSWGSANDDAPFAEQARRRAELTARQDANPFFWRPPGGESIADACLRADRVLDTLHRECGEMENVVMCLHGEAMWTFRIRLEQMRVPEFERLHHSKDSRERIHNCQVLHYTRQNPQDPTAPPQKNFGWFRSACPPSPNLDGGAKWREIVRPRPTGAELLAEVEETPRLID